MQQTSKERLPELDALRGLAALVVVMSHALHVLPAFGAWHWAGPESLPIAVIRHTPLFTLVDGHAAVMVFFVLSGLVLSRPLLASSRPAYSAYLSKRVWRLYPPYAAAVLLSAMAQAALGARLPKGPSPWLMVNWTDRPGPDVALSYVMMLGRSVALDNPVWTLDYEMRLSLVLPLLFWPLRSFGGKLGFGLAVMLLFGGEAVFSHIPHWQAAVMAQLLVYGGMFVLGATLGQNLPTVRRVSKILPRGAPELAAWAILWMNWRESILGLGAAVLIAAALGRGPLAWLCARRSAHFLGKISYSLYLVHVPVLLILLAATAGHLPQAAAAAAMPPCAIAVAWVFYCLIEAPTHRLARYISLAPARPETLGLEPARERQR